MIEIFSTNESIVSSFSNSDFLRSDISSFADSKDSLEERLLISTSKLSSD